MGRRRNALWERFSATHYLQVTCDLSPHMDWFSPHSLGGLAMVVVPSSAWPVRIGVGAGLLLLATFLLTIALLYPRSDLLLPAIVVALVLTATTVWMVGWGAQPGSDAGRLALQWGARIGAITGVLWLLEIGFNNLLPPALSVPARDLVDNLFWLLIVLLLFFTATFGAWRTARWSAGLRIGAWGGSISGLFAALAGTALVIFGMPLLLKDPFTQAEWAERGASSGIPDLASYVARDTSAGALGHLIALGLLMGAILGLLGGAVGRGLAAWRPPQPENSINK
jgi:hypothetical protein